MKRNYLPKAVHSSVAILIASLSAWTVLSMPAEGICYAQGTGVGGGGGNTGGGLPGVGLPGGGVTGGGVTGGNTGGGGGGTSGGATPGVLDSAQFEDIRREVRFVGVSLDTIVHPYSSALTIETDAEAIGGRAAAGTQTTANTAGGVTANSPFQSPFEQALAQAFGFGGATNQAPAIIRSQVRFSRDETLGPSYRLPNVQTINVARTSDANNRLRSLPGMSGQNFQVQVQDKVTIVTGVVESEARKQQVERLLKLQPGVYKIENRLQVSNQ